LQMKGNLIRLLFTLLFLAVCAAKSVPAPMMDWTGAYPAPSLNQLTLKDGGGPYPPLCPNGPGPCRLVAVLKDGGIPYPPLCPNGPGPCRLVALLKDGSGPYPPICPNGPGPCVK
jgi:hypothetical protein